jgi:hypothetical protein
MSYTLIKGWFHIHYPNTPLNGPEPDGDTLKFQPDNRRLIESLPRPNFYAKFNQAGMTSIRCEAYDSLETHYDIEGQEYHQEINLALEARDTLLAEAGFGQVTYYVDSPAHKYKVKTVENHPIRGYILANTLDTYGRTVAFIFAGDRPEVDGSRVFVTPQDIGASLNAIMLQKGEGYGAFYLGLPTDLRDHLKGIAGTARAAGAGLWQKATATPGTRATIDDPAQLQNLVLWPKLFRRLAAFYQDGNTDLAALDAWLRADPRNRDDRLLLPGPELGNLHDLIEVSGNKVWLKHKSEDVVVVPDDYVLDDVSTLPETAVHIGTGAIRIVGALIDVAGPERGNETVTILNTTTADIDLAGCVLADGHGRMPLNGNLASGESQRIRLTPAVQLSNQRDTITVLGANDEIIDQVAYESRQLPPEGHTMVF